VRRFLIIFFSIFFFLSIFSPVFAVTVDISSCPTSITDQPFECNFSITGSTSDINYLRIDLYKDGTSNYFGETSTNTGWYSGSDGKQYYSTSTSSGSIKGKIGNPSVGEYPGSGNYKIRIRRYTASGNPASGDSQTPKNIEINFQLPTPTPTQTSNTPTTTPTQTTSSPTKSPLPTKKPTATPTQTSVDQLNLISTSGETKVNLPSSILGSSTESSNISPTPTKTENNGFSFINIIYIAGGIILILSGIFALTFVAKNRFKKI